MQPYVMFAGTVEPRKNLRRLLRAFAKIPRRDVDLVLVGPAGWNESLDAELAALGDRAHVLGFVDRDVRDAAVAEEGLERGLVMDGAIGHDAEFSIDEWEFSIEGG